MGGARRSADVVVVGGGITGAFTAYFLASRGLATTLVERHAIGVHASGSNPGGLNPLHGPGIPGPLADFAMDAFRLHLEHWEAIERLSGIALHGRRVERIQLALDEDDVAGLRESAALHDAADGFSAEWLARRDLADIAPGIAPEFRTGLLVRGNAAVDSRRYAPAVARAAVALGARIEIGTVGGINRAGNRATRVVVDGGGLTCGAVVVATGPWMDGPSRWLDAPLPIEPLKGEMLVVETSHVPMQHDVTWRQAGLYRQTDGTTWLGGTVDRGASDPSPTPAGRAAIRDRTTRMVPATGEVPLRDHFGALRPVAPDGFPMFGRVPGWTNAYVGTGGGQKGMLFGAVMGWALAEQIATGASRYDALPVCSPTRFARGG